MDVDHDASFVQAAYILAALLFILALAGLCKHETARRGNTSGMTGMAPRAGRDAAAGRSTTSERLDYDDHSSVVGRPASSSWSR